MNALDNERESRATDALLNYETVKYFCNEAFELAAYDKATRQYQVNKRCILNARMPWSKAIPHSPAAVLSSCFSSVIPLNTQL